MNVDLPAGMGEFARVLVGSIEAMRGRVAAAIERAEVEVLWAHEAGTCRLSEWSCSHCEAAAERMGS